MKLFLTYLVIFLVCPLLNEGFINGDSFGKDLYNLQKEFFRIFKIKALKLIDEQEIKNVLDNLNITRPNERSFIKDKKLCGICHKFVKLAKGNLLPVKDLGKAICEIYVTLSTLTTSNFCEDIIRINLPIIKYIVKNSKILDPELACSIMLQNKNCYSNKPALKWRSQVPSKSLMKIPKVNHNPYAKPVKILHLSDIHITPDYEVGGVDECGYPLCCKKNLGNPIFGQNAGKWGDYNCDIPPRLFEQTMLYINQTHKDIDLVYFTGDVIDHTVWKASISDNTDLLIYTLKTFFETFKGTPVLPIIGNHETAPVNVFAPPEDDIEKKDLSTQWLYTLLSKLWSAWLPEKSLVTVKKQGYYSYTVNNKFKIISLNNNICYIYNWWLLYNTSFLTEQLDFLSKELEEAEQNEQFVHILTHIPVGNKECIEPWEANFNNLVERFSHIIKGQFYGHTHTDELKIFYDVNHIPINIGYNGASLTPYQKFNPNYKLIVVDPNSFDVLDVETYYFNLTEANKHLDQTPRWVKLYSMKDAYELNDLSPTNFNKVAENIFMNETLFNQYWRYYVRDGDDSLKEGCNKECNKEVSCKIITTESLNSKRNECS